jgi:hypothetical protein
MKMSEDFVPNFGKGTGNMTVVNTQPALLSFPEHDFHDAFKKIAEALKGTTSRVMVDSRAKVSLCPDGSTSPGTMGVHFRSCALNYFISNLDRY